MDDTSKTTNELKAYEWKRTGLSGQTAVIMGYGTAVADVVLQSLTEAGMKVAIVSRTQSKLDAAAAKYNLKLGEGTVKGFSFDLANVAGVKDLMASIATDMGSPIKVVYYNAAKFSLPFDASPEEVIAGCSVNFATLWSTFGAMLEEWTASGGGVFLMSGGGFALNGAYSVGFGAQFGSTQKAFMKNFAESAQATHVEKGIHVCALEISGLVFGGDNVPGSFNSDPEGAKAFAGRLKAAVGAALVDKTGQCNVNVQ